MYNMYIQIRPVFNFVEKTTTFNFAQTSIVKFIKYITPFSISTRFSTTGSPISHFNLCVKYFC